MSYKKPTKFDCFSSLPTYPDDQTSRGDGQTHGWAGKDQFSRSDVGQLETIVDANTDQVGQETKH